MLDEDLAQMNADDLRVEVIKLRQGIRAHRDRSGHELCWYVPELWELLPEKYKPTPEVPPTNEFLKQCRAYRNSLDWPHITVHSMSVTPKPIRQSFIDSLINVGADESFIKKIHKYNERLANPKQTLWQRFCNWLW